MHLFSLTVNFWFWEIRVAICFHIFKNGTGIYFLSARNLCFWEACGVEIFLELAYLLIKCPNFFAPCRLQLKIASSFVIIVSIESSSYVYLSFFIYIIQYKLVAISFDVFTLWKCSSVLFRNQCRPFYGDVVFHFLSPVFTYAHYQIFVGRFN